MHLGESSLLLALHVFALAQVACRGVSVAAASSTERPHNSTNVANPLASYSPIDGLLCIRPEFVETAETTSVEDCALACTNQTDCQAFSLQNDLCQLFVFDACSKSVRDCSCSRRGQVFVKQQPRLQPGALCPSGYGDDLCGVKYKVYSGYNNWSDSRQICNAESGLVIMADVVDATEMAHVDMLCNKYSDGIGFWLGGFQAPGSPEPSGGWSWVACDLPVDSSLWGSGEPNNDVDRENHIARQPHAAGLNDLYEYTILRVLCECNSPFD